MIDYLPEFRIVCNYVLIYAVMRQYFSIGKLMILGQNRKFAAFG